MYNNAMKTLLALLLVVVSIVGIADAGYITYEKTIMGVTPPCGEGFDCGTVLDSPWASIGPIPLSVIGMFFYLTVFIFAILYFMEIEINPAVRKAAAKLSLGALNPIRFLSTFEALQILTTIGFLFSLYLVFIMGVVIKAWCTYCTISAISSSTLFIITLILTGKYQNHSSFLLKSISFAIFRNLYKIVLKPLLFLFDAETVHNTFTAGGQFIGRFALGRKLTHAFFAFDHPVLKQTIDGITFPNPVGLAGGFDYNGALTQVLPDVGFGHHIIGTVTFDPYEGNAKPRLGRFPNSKALLVNKGLKSLGAVGVIKHLQNLEFRIPTGISIASTNKLFADTKEQLTDILSTFKLFESSTVQHSYYELNISCPNTFGGEPFTSPERLEVLLSALDELMISRPVYIKMPIDQSEKETLALLKVIDRHVIAGVVFGNLTKDKKNPAILPEDRKVWKTKKGNVSGKPTWERSNNLIALTQKHFPGHFTIIGTGGVFTGKDAEGKRELGAELVQLITGMIFNGPQAIGEINLYLARKALADGLEEKVALKQGALNYSS